MSRERLLPPYEPVGPISDEDFNLRLHQLAEAPGISLNYLGHEDDAWFLVGHLLGKGWRIGLDGAGGCWAAVLIADAADGTPLRWVPQYGSSRAEALARAMLDSLLRVRHGMIAESTETLAMCLACKGHGFQRVGDTQVDALNLLRRYGPCTTARMHSIAPQRTATGWSNALARLVRRGVVERTRVRGGKAWIYRVK